VLGRLEVGSEVGSEVGGVLREVLRGRGNVKIGEIWD
jgi:hypothetical protein